MVEKRRIKGGTRREKFTTTTTVPPDHLTIVMQSHFISFIVKIRKNAFLLQTSRSQGDFRARVENGKVVKTMCYLLGKLNLNTSVLVHCRRLSGTQYRNLLLYSVESGRSSPQ
jgi:hypothetical protein